ncbi:uncharacterized protein LOC5509810 [Nematostella vectensis]|uniref:uncharacterized protein LOC5509810 n=1 Tax=Nematostella vectensis TaxID=45351 RepID=UPI0013905EE3|nr:uncharacterized protein LOC5509810 [Nematostella vectensis]
MRFLVFLLVLLSNTIICIAHGQGRIAGYRFLRYLKYRFRCDVIHTLNGVNRDDCRNRCANNLGCYALNTIRGPNGTEMCELLRPRTDSRYSENDCFIKQENSEHNSLLDVDHCPPDKPCSKRVKKVLDGGWYQFGTNAWKLFTRNLNWEAAVSACTAEGAELTPVTHALDAKFLAEAMLARITATSRPQLPSGLNNPSSYYRLDGTDNNVQMQFVRGRWTHLAFVIDRKKFSVAAWQDGLFVGKSADSDVDQILPTLNKLDLGCQNYFDGLLSQLLIFDRAFDSQQVAALRDATMMDRRAWTGLNDINTEGQYRYADMSTNGMGYLNWGTAGSTAHSVAFDCVALSAWDEGKMLVENCNITLPYVCMKKVP